MSQIQHYDCIGQEIKMGDILSFTSGKRDGAIDIGVVTDYNHNQSSIKVSYLPRWVKKWDCAHTVTVNNSDDRCTVITDYYLNLSSKLTDHEIVYLHVKLNRSAWPKPKRQPVSNQSPVAKWLKSFEKRVLNSNPKFNRLGGKFSTTHNGETVYTFFDLEKSGYTIAIGTSGGYWGRYNNYDCRIRDGKITKTKDVFGIDWFNEPRIQDALDKIPEKQRQL